MTVEALRYRLLHDRPRFRASWLLFAAVGIWAALVVAIALQLVTVTYEASLWLVLGVPTAFVLAACLTLPGSPAKLAAGLTLLVSTALIMPGLVATAPAMAYVVPGLLISAVVFTRYPAAGFIGLVFMTGTLGSLEAFLDFPTGPAVDVVLFGLWLGALWMALTRRREHPTWIWVGVVLAVAFVALNLLEALLAGSLSFGLQAFRAVAWYVAAFLLVAYVRWRPGTRELLTYGVLAVGAVVGIYATVRYFIGPAPQEAALAASTDPTNVLNGELGLVGSFHSRKALAGWAAMVAPFCLVMAMALRGPWRAVAAVAFASLTVAILAAQVRTGLIAGAVACLLVIALFALARGFGGPHVGTTAAVVLAIPVMVVGAFLITAGTSPETTERYRVILTPSQDQAVSARLLRWNTVLDDLDTSPLGHGIGTAGRIQRQEGRFTNISSYDIDNSYLQIAYEQGLAILALFLATLLALLVGLARRALLTAVPTRAAVGIGACGTLVAYMIELGTGSFVEGLGTLVAFLIVGLGIGQFVAPGAARSPARTSVHD